VIEPVDAIVEGIVVEFSPDLDSKTRELAVRQHVERASLSTIGWRHQLPEVRVRYGSWVLELKRRSLGACSTK
jgi:hypothetical protein